VKRCADKSFQGFRKKGFADRGKQV
jgi:hypothetical protein